MDRTEEKKLIELADQVKAYRSYFDQIDHMIRGWTKLKHGTNLIRLHLENKVTNYHFAADLPIEMIDMYIMDSLRTIRDYFNKSISNMSFRAKKSRRR